MAFMLDNCIWPEFDCLLGRNSAVNVISLLSVMTEGQHLEQRSYVSVVQHQTSCTGACLQKLCHRL
jgi:hypothetical protein